MPASRQRLARMRRPADQRGTAGRAAWHGIREKSLELPLASGASGCGMTGSGLTLAVDDLVREASETTTPAEKRTRGLIPAPMLNRMRDEVGI